MNAQQQPNASKYWGRAGFWLAVALVAQVVLILLFVIWNVSDARLETLTFPQALRFHTPVSSDIAVLPVGLARLFSCLIWLAVLLCVLLASSLFWARRQFRSIRYVGIYCGLLAVWLSIFTQWERISWLGHRVRAGAVVLQLAPIADELSKDWPRYDGWNESIGPFMAYPNREPRTLILLTPLPIGNQFGSLAAIDRDAEGRMWFELSRGGDSLWLEWSPEQAPSVTKFTNGIGASYQRRTTIPVDDRWSVSRFE